MVEKFCRDWRGCRDGEGCRDWAGGFIRTAQLSQQDLPLTLSPPLPFREGGRLVAGWVLAPHSASA